MPVYLWHGEQDEMCPVAMGRYVAESIPDCRATFYPHDGHLSLLMNRYEEILATVVN